MEENKIENIENLEENTGVKEPTKKKLNWKREILEWIEAIVIALVVAVVLRNFVLTLVTVQGESMEPTLQNADRLYVNRLFYTPEKGDIIIFKPASDPKRPYVKRVIATEGDTVYIDFITGDVFVNDELLDEPYILEKTHLIDDYITSLIEQGKYSKENPIVVEKDTLFVMGDNRNNSKDSRDLGLVPVDEVMGQAIFRFWPLNNIDKF